MPNATSNVVLITGASSGIGKCCAEHLAKRGYRVFGTQRRTSAVVPAVDMIPMDVDDDGSVAEGVETVIQKTGRLDAVINNAGWGLMGAIEDTSTAEAKAQL